MKRKQFVVLAMLLAFTLPMAGCGTTPITPPTPTTLQNITTLFDAVGLAVATFVPLSGQDGVDAVATIKLICAINPSDPNAMTSIQVLLQQLFSQLSASQATAAAAAVVIAIDLAWDYLTTQTQNQDAKTVTQYIQAAITGLCAGVGTLPGTTHWLAK